jgi:hypothetical protein
MTMKKPADLSDAELLAFTRAAADEERTAAAALAAARAEARARGLAIKTREKTSEAESAIGSRTRGSA